MHGRKKHAGKVNITITIVQTASHFKTRIKTEIKRIKPNGVGDGGDDDGRS